MHIQRPAHTTAGSGTDNRIGVAVIGTGAIASTHAAAISQVDGLELRAIGSRSPESGRRFIESHERYWTSPHVEARTLDEILDDERIELVSVVTPTGTHTEIGARVLAAGRHLLLEKPIDVDVRRTVEFAELAARAEEAGLVAAAVSQHRFDPAASVVREAIETGRMGQLTSGVVSVGWWRSQAYYDRDEWRGTWAQDGGGALMNQGLHTLDLLLWFFGRPVRVTASSRTLAHERIEVEDTLAAIVEFDSGAIATVHATTSAFPGLAARLQVMGSTGSAIIEHEGLSYLHLADGSDIGDMGIHGAGNQVIPPNHACNRDATTTAAGHRRQFADIAAAIREGRRTLMTIGDAVDTLLTIHAIYRSATTGRPVEIADIAKDPHSVPYRVGRTPHDPSNDLAKEQEQ